MATPTLKLKTPEVEVIDPGVREVHHITAGHFIRPPKEITIRCKPCGRIDTAESTQPFEEAAANEFNELGWRNAGIMEGNRCPDCLAKLDIREIKSSFGSTVFVRSMSGETPRSIL